MGLSSPRVRYTMSKQLTLSAVAAVLSMAAFALAAGFGDLSANHHDQLAGHAPLLELTATN